MRIEDQQAFDETWGVEGGYWRLSGIELLLIMPDIASTDVRFGGRQAATPAIHDCRRANVT